MIGLNTDDEEVMMMLLSVIHFLGGIIRILLMQDVCSDLLSKFDDNFTIRKKMRLRVEISMDD